MTEIGGAARPDTARQVKAVVFDVGETLVDETRVWSGWADRLGVTRLTFMAALGAGLARGESHRNVFDLFHPGYDIDAEWRRLVETGDYESIALDDLYPDAIGCLQALVADGYRVGVAANQPPTTADVMATLPVPLAVNGMSDVWGLHKPDAAFFARIAHELDLPPAEIAYVGDRTDFDVTPAHAAGMVAVFLRRGPWAWINAPREAPPGADLVVDSLAELPVRLRRSPFARTGS
jgi:HAD superfamily hydrolase (TIGR01549 family)